MMCAVDTLLYPECDVRRQVLTERLVPEGSWFKARAGRLRIDIQDYNHIFG